MSKSEKLHETTELEELGMESRQAKYIDKKLNELSGAIISQITDLQKWVTELETKVTKLEKSK